MGLVAVGAAQTMPTRARMLAKDIVEEIILTGVIFTISGNAKEWRRKRNRSRWYSANVLVLIERGSPGFLYTFEKASWTPCVPVRLQHAI